MEPLIAMTPAHVCDPHIAIAACRAGAQGILDAGLGTDPQTVATALNTLSRHAGSTGRWGLRWDTLGLIARQQAGLTEIVRERLEVLVLAGLAAADLAEGLAQGRRLAKRVFLEVYDVPLAQRAQATGYDGVIVKGHEAGGRISPHSSFVLLQKLRRHLSIPYWMQGGIGLHTVAATVLAGAAGAVLHEQLWLTAEAPFSSAQRAGWRQFDGSETVVVGRDDHLYRVSKRSGRRKVRELEMTLARGADWSSLLTQSLLQTDDEPLLPIGQDLAFAASLGERYETVGRLITAFRESIGSHLELARVHRPLAADSPLAQRHQTRYPIVQGPMTRVSDVAPFAKVVAEAGGLPFLALSVMRGPEVRALLSAAKTCLGALPWGVGILGFVPTALRQEQLAIIRDVQPPFALIAGGRPSQAAELETQGISTYLHVPSPGLLRLFLKDGARKFVFEGNECGGHIGPRTSFVLWGLAVETLLTAGIADPESVQVLFAGGIHDALSAAAAACVAAPLAAHGMQVGVLMGSAYLFTPEIVATGAILPEYQQQALACEQTALLTSGTGYMTRGARTPFCDEFATTRHALLLAGKDDAELLETLERLNLGRLRIASKGITHNPHPRAADGSDRYIRVDTDTQRREGMYMLGDVAALRHTTLSVADLHAEVCSRGTTLLAEAERPAVMAAPPDAPRSDIAIVGMACLLPGAPDLRRFWQNILNRVVAIREVSDERWRPTDFFDPDRLAPDMVYSKWGGFLDDVQFDPTAYGIPPASMRSIEPMQLLGLAVTRAALQDAGLDHLAFPRERTAVIFGAGGSHDLACDYIFRTMLRHYLPRVPDLSEETRQHIIDSLYRQLPQWTEDSFPGMLGNVLAGRIANRLDLRGSNFTVDAACASSLAALDVGAKQLRAGEADVAVVGAVDGTTGAVPFMSFAKTHALSPRGRCRPFDDSADGIAISEGVAVLVLKRLHDAERDGDRIYAVLRGIGSASDGRNRSLTAPHPAGQVMALRRAYEDAGVDPTTVELIEAHGTGTAIGDKSEIEALLSAFGDAYPEPQYCAIGSVKSMIGHTKVAAGFAGLIKGVLALKHRILPPTMGVERPNASVDFPQTPFYINTTARPWFKSRRGHPRRCGVSAFGFGGTNFHAVLEEYTGDHRPASTCDLTSRAAEIFALTRASQPEVMQAVSQLLHILDHAEHLDLAELAQAVHARERTAPPGRDGRACRLAVVATSVADLRQKLQDARRELPSHTALTTPQGIYYGEHTSAAGRLCFLFPGQGAQKIHMLQDLVVSLPCLHGPFERADALLGERLEHPLSRYIFPLPVFTDAERDLQQAALNATRIAQPALGVTDLAAFDILTHFGMRPDFVAGHSYGEYVALCVAGVISRDDLLRLSEIRGRLSAEASQHCTGAMAAVQADATSTAQLIEKLALPVTLASLNAPDQTIVGGTAQAIEQAVPVFVDHRLRARRIPVTAAFHTAAMTEAATALAAELERVEFHRASLPVYANTTGERYPESPLAIREILVRHIVEPLRFTDQVRRLYEDGARIFVETGPGQILSSLVRRILGDRPHTTLALDAPGRPGWLQLAHLLAQSLALGVPVDLGRWFEHRGLTASDPAQLSEQARALANPKPTVWRVNGGRALPWHESPTSVPCQTQETPGHAQTPRQVTASSTLPRQSVPQGRVDNPGSAQTMTSNEAQHGTAETPTASSAATSDPLTAHIQTNMTQLLGLLQGQQQIMQQCLQMQQQLLSAVLQGRVTTSTPQGLQPAQPAPPAVPTGLNAVPPVPTLPPLPIAPPVQMPPPASPTPQSAVPSPPMAQPAAPPPTDGKIHLPPTTADFEAALLHTVSERTGYPLDMLDLDAHMEADLGIDSIKWVEIFGAMKDHQDLLQGRDEETVLEEIATLKTLRHIIEWYDTNRSRLLTVGAQAEKKNP
jgi:acyl transferase domain-containing protein/NAD(P)H-dependent flavin oxidoreductase YrpB (nitropropane dioxygenase family)